MGQIDLLLVVWFCFGHKQSYLLTGNILFPDFTSNMTHRVKGCQVCVSFCPGKPIHTPPLPWISLTIDLSVCQITPPSPPAPTFLVLMLVWPPQGQLDTGLTSPPFSIPPSSIRRPLTDIYLHRYGPCGGDKGPFQASFCIDIKMLVFSRDPQTNGRGKPNSPGLSDWGIKNAYFFSSSRMEEEKGFVSADAVEL